jgi:hypothetical protein
MKLDIIRITPELKKRSESWRCRLFNFTGIKVSQEKLKLGIRLHMSARPCAKTVFRRF